VTKGEAGVGLVVRLNKLIRDIEESLSGVELSSSNVRFAVLHDVLHVLVG